MSEEFYIKVLEDVKEYMQDNIDKGYHKFIYNDLGWDDKCVDVISAIDMLIEKNKELLEGLKYRVNYCKLLEKELYSNGINYNMELTKIEQKYLQELLEERN